jgi:hypothetical protein
MATGTIIALSPRVRRRVTAVRRPPPPADSGGNGDGDGDGHGGVAAPDERPDPDVIGAGAPV